MMFFQHRRPLSDRRFQADRRANRKATGRRGLRGFSLPTVLGLSALLAVGLSVVFVALSSSARITGDMIKRRKAFYVCDGLSRTLVKASQDYFLSTAVPTAVGLRTNLEAVGGGPTLPNLTPAGYSTTFTVNTSGTSTTGVIPNGPFRNMNAQLNDLGLAVKSIGPNGEVCETNENLTVGLIGLFQFFGFTDGPNEIVNSASINVSGRIHANGDFCANSFDAVGDRTQLSMVTASGRFLHASNCVHAPGGSGTGVFIQNTGGPGSFTAVTNANDNFSPAWQVFANTVLAGNVQDVAHSVNPLRIPFTVSPQMQDGRDMVGTTRDNSSSFRFFIDPVLGSDNAQIRDEKLAWQASIRIINGIWYRNDGTWPGVMIYSDHRLTYDTANAEGYEGTSVGFTSSQDALVNIGTRYSYYEGSAGGLLNDTPASGVISYGSLFRIAPSTVPATAAADWVPGCGTGNAMVDALNDSAASGAGPPGAACVASGGGVAGDRLLQGTRSGFVDHRVTIPDGTSPTPLGAAVPGNILPINFDVRQFTAAMGDANPGELGSIFNAGNPFNGIVWIGQTWNNQMQGLGGGLAQSWPLQGGASSEQAAFPENLCGAAQQLTTSQVAPACGGTAIPNAVRVHNADVINNVVFPEGLTIGTNLPGYLLGNTNTGSLTPANWVPFLFAADSVTLLSNAWDDSLAPWTDNQGFAARTAAPTTYLAALFTGVVNPTGGTSNGGFINFPRFIEQWTGQSCTITGSLVSGFTSVFQDQPWTLTDYYRPPVRNWSFDSNLFFVTNQPPGTPTFMVSAIRSWERN